jgi:hypothetical protein
VEPRFYYRLADPSLAGWLMVFKRRVKAIYDSGVRSYNRFEISDLFSVQMRIDGDIIYVNVDGGASAYFEFQTSGFPGDYSMPVGGVNTYRPEVIGVRIGAGGSLTLHESLLGGQHVDLAADVSALAIPNQVQLLDEPVAYPGPQSALKGYPDVLFESYSPGHSHTGAFIRAYFCQYLPYYTFVPCVSVTAQKSRDVLFDASFATASSTSKYKPAYLTDSSYDWPRASGIQTVTDPTWGVRKFAIIVDAFDQVNVFPTSEIGPEIPIGGAPTQNVDPSVVKTQRVAFPSWVYHKTVKFRDFWNPLDAGNVGLTDFPEIDWKLHPDGTHMCAVVHERVEAQLDTSFFNTYATTTGTQGKNKYWPDATSFYSLLSNAMGWPPEALGNYASISTDKWYHVATGLLEVQLDIAITGPNPSDFTLNLINIEERRPTTSPYASFVAGYVWHSIKGKCDRGDLCVLDIECYGDPVTGHTGQLWSVKNLSDGTEIMTFGAASTHVDNTFTKGNVLSEECLLVAYNMKTLSFVTKDQGAEIHFYGFDRYGYDIRDKIIHFGVSVRVMAEYKDTLFPEIMVKAARDVILDNAKNGTRARLLGQFPGLQFMPLNDLRGWGDTDLDSLRESYARDASPIGPYVAGFDPLSNFAEIETKGHLYWRSTRITAVPTSSANIWYNDLMAQNGLRPFPMWYVTEPRPGWQLYMRQFASKLFVTPNTTFFTHPNGTWALFDQSFIYNANAMLYPYFDPFVDKLIGTTVSELLVTKLEHCIFDKVHFAVTVGQSTATLDTSFLKMYNAAIKRAKQLGTLQDDSDEMQDDYSDIRAKFSVNTVPDPFDGTVSYAQLQMDWYSGFRAYLHDTGYFNGKKDWAVGFSSYPSGGLLVPSMGGWWDDSTLSFLIDPFHFNGTQITFSTCVLITT